MTAADSRAFYRLLDLTKAADVVRLRQEAELLDPAAAARLFRQPAAERGRLVRGEIESTRDRRFCRRLRRWRSCCE